MNVVPAAPSERRGILAKNSPFGIAGMDQEPSRLDFVLSKRPSLPGFLLKTFTMRRSTQGCFCETTWPWKGLF